MTGLAPRRALVLSHHAAYACRRSGACCTAGWRIPVEEDRVTIVRASVSDGAGSAGLPDAAVFEPGSRILRLTAAGACVCFEPAPDGRPHSCAVHRRHGHAALPSACRHFPRVFLHDARGTRVALSHFCPTAASLLFAGGAGGIVEADVLVQDGDCEGLDARTVLPPLLHPRMLMDVESYASWEASAIDVLASGCPPREALTRIAWSVERLRAWRPDTGPLSEAVRAAADAPQPHNMPGWMRNDRWLVDAALNSVPDGLAVDDAWARSASVDEPGMAGLAQFPAPVCRYLAGRLFGSWIAYQGRGLRTVTVSVAAAFHVLRMQAEWRCRAAGRPLDEPLLVESIRAADLLLVHQVDSGAFAHRLSRVEDARG